MKCRHCAAELTLPFLDLGTAPPSNAYLDATQLHAPELWYPLRLLVCETCWLVQTEDYARADELFSADYAYFSSTSSSWLDHAARYAKMITQRLELGAHSQVVELASNDGYLLKNFVAAGIPCLGIEPTASTAAAAEQLGIPVLREFFGTALAQQLAAQGKQADLIIGNNVYAHVPDVNDFTAGMAALLKSDGSITLEFPHLLRLIEQCQFDTVYHEHFSYFSLHTVRHIFARAGLRVWDVEELTTHGGSLRVYGCHAGGTRATSAAVTALLAREEEYGLCTCAPYLDFQARAEQVKNGLLTFLIEQKRLGKKVAAYGAAAKGNTLLNYAGVKRDLLPYVCDAAPSKQNKFLPGARIPILPPTVLQERQPDVVLILPWNIAPEVLAQQAQVRSWGGRFFVAVPEVREVT
ncbi:MAG: class I SAM-dependent methyltransferase [Burkholderiaceae bacterium]|nr:MAG: class I SAM-dependent methyltransferase [Burkholderiaceae bacterium]